MSKVYKKLTKTLQKIFITTMSKVKMKDLITRVIMSIIPLKIKLRHLIKYYMPNIILLLKIKFLVSPIKSSTVRSNLQVLL